MECAGRGDEWRERDERRVEEETESAESRGKRRVGASRDRQIFSFHGRTSWHLFTLFSFSK